MMKNNEYPRTPTALWALFMSRAANRYHCRIWLGQGFDLAVRSGRWSIVGRTPELEKS